MAQENPISALTQGPELRLVDRRAYIGFPRIEVAPGVIIQDFSLQIPDVTFPFSLTGGPAKYQKKRLDFGSLELFVSQEAISQALQQHKNLIRELRDVQLRFRPHFIEVRARTTLDNAPLTFKIAFDADRDGLVVYTYDFRVYAQTQFVVARLGRLIATAVKDSAILGQVTPRRASGFSLDILPSLVESAAVSRGYRIPSLDEARLATVTVAAAGITVRFASLGLPPAPVADESLLLTLEGENGHKDAEALLVKGDIDGARNAYLKVADVGDAHPFALERLLTLLVLDERAHDFALDVAQTLLRRRENNPTALWVEALIRERRNEPSRAAEKYLALSQLSRKAEEEFAAFCSAEAAARVATSAAPKLAVQALHEMLGVSPDHVPSLNALARAADQAHDRAGAMRAYRRLAALAKDPKEAAEAHVQLARLQSANEDDLAGARLHCEAALRLAPDHPDALEQLGTLCQKSEEPLRAIKCFDRLKEVTMARHEVDRVGRANLLAGHVWFRDLKQFDNALLRYKEAAALVPQDPEPLVFVGRTLEALNKSDEAVVYLLQATELLGPAPESNSARALSHEAHKSLARHYKNRANDAQTARRHFEAALELDSKDIESFEAVIPFYRLGGRHERLADALESAAEAYKEQPQRAALYCEAGDLARLKLEQKERAEKLYEKALNNDPKLVRALEGLLALAESRRDGALLVRTLSSLAELRQSVDERKRDLRRLSVAARDVAFDLNAASQALWQLVAIDAQDLASLGELCALERRRGDVELLAKALDQRARISEILGDKRLAAASLKELSTLLHHRLGRNAEAYVALEKSSRLVPDTQTLIEFAQLAMRMERPNDARKALDEVLRDAPGHMHAQKLAEVRALFAEACLALGFKTAAKENFAFALSQRKNDDALATKYEALLDEVGTELERIEFLSTRAETLRSAGRTQEAASLYLKAAQLYQAAGNLDDARSRLLAVVESSHTGAATLEALSRLAEIEENRGQNEEAARLWGLYSERIEDPLETARTMTRAAKLSKNQQRTLHFLNQAIVRESKYAPARYLRAHLLAASDAVQSLEDIRVMLSDEALGAISVFDETPRPEILKWASQVAQKANRDDFVETFLAEYRILRPADTEALGDLAALYRRVGAHESLYRTLREYFPRVSGETRDTVRKELVRMAHAQGHTLKELDAFREEVQLHPADSWAAEQLLTALTPNAATLPERLSLLSNLITENTGATRSLWLQKRAELQAQLGNDRDAANDFVAAAQNNEANKSSLVQRGLEFAQKCDDAQLLLDIAKKGLPFISVEALAPTLQNILHVARASQRLGTVPARVENAYQLLVDFSNDAEVLSESHWALAFLKEQRGETQQTIAHYEAASALGSAAQRARASIEKARLLEAQKDLRGAAQAYERALVQAPADEKIFAKLKALLIALQDNVALAELLQSQANISTAEKASALLRELAILYTDVLGTPTHAEAALQKWLKFQPDAYEANERLCRLLAAADRKPEALKRLDSITANSNSKELFISGASWAYELGDFASELKWLRKAHALPPSSASVEGNSSYHDSYLARLGALLYQHGAIDEALAIHKELWPTLSFEKNLDDTISIALRYASILSDANDTKHSAVILREVLRARPHYAHAAERLFDVTKSFDVNQAKEGFEQFADGLSESAEKRNIYLTLIDLAENQADLESVGRLTAKLQESNADKRPLLRRQVALLKRHSKSAALVDVLLPLAEAEMSAGELAEAEVRYQEMANAALVSGRIAEALLAHDRIVEMGRAGAPGSLVERADIHFRHKQNTGAALADIAESFRLKPSFETATAGLVLSREVNDFDSIINWLLQRRTVSEQKEARGQDALELAQFLVTAESQGRELSAAQKELIENNLKECLALKFEPQIAQTLLLAYWEKNLKFYEMAQLFESQADSAADATEQVVALVRAATLYREKCAQPERALALLFAAHTLSPADVNVTELAADAAHETRRKDEGAELDALLLADNPQHRAFDRHEEYLTATKQHQALALLLTRRAEKETGVAASRLWLKAGQAFRDMNANERAQLCEAQAFRAAPNEGGAIEAMLARAGDDPRRLAEVYYLRATSETPFRADDLKKRAVILTDANETLLAMQAWDDYLAVSSDDAEALLKRGDMAFEAQGARSAQPWYQRLLDTKFEFEPSVMQRVYWRLQEASFESRAMNDAAHLTELFLKTNPPQDTVRGALLRLVDIHTQRADDESLYDALMRLADLSSEAESAVLRMTAAKSTKNSSRAWDALKPIYETRVNEIEYYTLATQVLTRAGRVGELVALHERFAQSRTGADAAVAWLEAARLYEEEFSDNEKARALRERAVLANPNDKLTLQRLMKEHEKNSDFGALEKVLTQLLTLEENPLTKASLALRKVQLLEARNSLDEAIELTHSVLATVDNDDIVKLALDALEHLAFVKRDNALVAEVGLQKASRLGGEARARRLYEVAVAFKEAGKTKRAREVLEEAANTLHSAETLQLLADLCETEGDFESAALARRQGAALQTGDAKLQSLEKSFHLFHNIGDEGNARALFDELRENYGALLPSSLKSFIVSYGNENEARTAQINEFVATGHFSEAAALARGAKDPILLSVLRQGFESGHQETSAQWVDFLANEGGVSQVSSTLDTLSRRGMHEAEKRLLLASYRRLMDAELFERMTQFPDVLDTLANDAVEGEMAPLIEVLIEHTDVLSTQALVGVVGLGVEVAPARAKFLLRVLADRLCSEGQYLKSEKALHDLARIEQNTKARAALNAERGEMWLVHLSDPAEARLAFERAFAEDPALIQVGRRLASLYKEVDDEKYVDAVERVRYSFDKEQFLEHSLSMSLSLQKLGRLREAYAWLEHVPFDEPTDAQRLALARALNLKGDELQIRERRANSSAEKLEVLRGYLKYDLTVPAQRLANALLNEIELPKEVLREVSEKLCADRQSAKVACRAASILLKANLSNVDAWQWLSIAFRELEENTLARHCDGVACLLGHDIPTDVVQIAKPVERAEGVEGLRPESVIEVSNEATPRMFHFFNEMLKSLGAPNTKVFIDVSGASEVWLQDEHSLVVGGAALEAFDSAEFQFATAFALASGGHDKMLTPEGFETAFQAAFESVPSTYAAGHVMAQWSEAYREANPALTQVSSAMRVPAFRKLLETFLRKASGL